MDLKDGTMSDKAMLQSGNRSEGMTTNTCININDHLVQQAFDWTSLVGVRITVAMIYIFIFCAGIFGNAGVVMKVAKNRKLHSARNTFLLSLMASDFLLCLTAVPFTPISVIMKRWIFGGVICRLIPLCQSMSVIITSLSLTAIAVDKYIHIMDVTKPPVTIGQATGVVGVIWAVACAVNLPLVLSYDVFDGSMYQEEYGVSFCGEFCDEIHWSSLEYKKAYGTSIMCIQFVVPMLIIMFCYTCIMRKVRADMMIDNKQFSNSLSAMQRLGAIKKKRRVNYILIMMVLAFVGAWLPLTLFNILRDYNLLPVFVSYQPFLWALIVHSIAMTTVIWNPLLFFWLTGRVRTRRRRRQGSVEESLLVTFLLSSNPLRFLFRRGRRRRKDCSSGTDEESFYDATYTEHEFSTTAAAMSATNVAVYKADGWFKKKVSTASGGSSVSNVVHRNSSPTPILKRVSPAQQMIYKNYSSVATNGTPASSSCKTSPASVRACRLGPKLKTESLTDLNLPKLAYSRLSDTMVTVPRANSERLTGIKGKEQLV